MNESNLSLMLAGIRAATEQAREAVRKFSDALPKIEEHIKKQAKARLASMLVYANAVDAIGQHFEAMLNDKRLQADSESHAQMAEIFREIMELKAGKPFTSITAMSAFKDRAKRGGMAKKAAAAREKQSVRAYFQANRASFKNKDDAAFGIEGKTIEGVEITAKASTIRRYLRGA